MTKKTTKSGKSESNTAKIVAVGASVAALAATAYFFLGPDGKKHQKHAKAWAIKMKGEIVEKLEMVREISQPVYNEIVDSVAAEYAKTMKGDHAEVRQLANDLKKHWKTISHGAQSKS